MPHVSDATPLAGLSARWLDLALSLEAYSPPAAEAWRRAAQELAAALRESAEEILTLAESSRMGGYSIDHLQRQVATGAIRNAGRRGSPRILRADVPLKADRIATASAGPRGRVLSPRRRIVADAQAHRT